MKERHATFAGVRLSAILLCLLAAGLLVSCGYFKEQKENEAIVYYYRDPGPENLVSLLETTMKDGKVSPDSRQGKVLVHFFAAALQRDRGNVKLLDDLEQKYSGDKARLIKVVKDNALRYWPADLRSPEDIELVWAEYRATGNRELITKLIDAAADDNASKGTDVQAGARKFLIKTAPFHSEIYEMLGRAADDAPTENKKGLINEMSVAIKTSAREPASDCSIRGRNYYVRQQYDKAMEELNKGLAYYPDYYDIHLTIANVHYQQGNTREAIKAGRKASGIRPESPIAAGNVGLYYYRLRQWDEAIMWYGKALERDQRDAGVLYGLGSCYAWKKDPANAGIHYKKYLEYAPNGSHAAEIKGYLLRNGQIVSEDPTDVAVMLRNGRYDDLEKTLRALLKEKKRNKEGETLLGEAYRKLTAIEQSERSSSKRIPQFNGWIDRYPSSHFAYTALGMIYINYAWDARGGGYAHTITNEGSRIFRENLFTARGHLEKAYSLERTDPTAPTELIRVATGLGSGREEMEKQFKRAVTADPRDHGAYFVKLRFLMPKWYGSKLEMFSFAREAVKKAPANSKIPVTLALAHWEIYLRSDKDPTYFRNAAVWSDVKDSYETTLKAFPEAAHIHNWFARAASLAGDYETAAREFARIGDNWYDGAWGDKKNYESVRVRVGTR